MSSVSGGDCKLKPVSCKDAQPEQCLSWCLTHLSKPKKQKSDSQTVPKRSSMAQWRALVAIRTHHIKGHKSSISRFRHQGGLEPLLGLIRQTDCSRKTLDLALSILGNCCTERETCSEIRKLDGINTVVELMRKHVAQLSIQNRAARVLGNLAVDPENSVLIHGSGGVPLLLLCVSQSSSFSPSSTSSSPSPSSPSSSSPSPSSSSPPCTPSPSTNNNTTNSTFTNASTATAFPCPSPSPSPVEISPGLECAQSAARALVYLSDTPAHRLSLVSLGTVGLLCPLLAPELPLALRRASLRALHELTRGCGVECARQVIRCGVLTHLGLAVAGEGEDRALEELALKTLANLCAQGCLRPLVGALGVISRFVEEVKRDALKSGVFLKALCLCCKEAVNRAKVKECRGLEVLTGVLASHQNHPLSRFVIQACVDFVFDEAAVEQLQELGLVPLLVERLVQLSKGEEPVCSPCSNLPLPDLLPQVGLDSYDFPPPEEKREQVLGSSSFLSLRSWLLSEGLISSEGELLESSSSSESDWSGLPLPTTTTSTLTHKPSLSADTSSSPKHLSPPSCPSSSPVKPPSYPSRFRLCSALRRRPRHPPTPLAPPVAPPPMPRPSSYHPYHPEPWTAESPILLLLSRFSHASEPGAALVSRGVISGLLLYLTSHGDPSGRCCRMLLRLSVNPTCLQPLVRNGVPALIRYRLCDRDREEGEQQSLQSPRVKAKIRQLGMSLLSNLQLQCESGFGTGVLSHLMLSGTESDRLHCALSLPLITSNKTLLRKLLLDNGGLHFALQPLGGDTNSDPTAPAQTLSPDQPLHSLYCPLLVGCLSALNASFKSQNKTDFSSTNAEKYLPLKKRPRLDQRFCPYSSASFDLKFLLDNGTEIPASRVSVSGEETLSRSDYFRALLHGGFGEAHRKEDEAIRIKDVSSVMLMPVLHYLHGCRFAHDDEEAVAQGGCHILEDIVKEGINQSDDFENTVLGQAMVGACRFLVEDLRKELEAICVTLLNSEDAFDRGGRTQDENVSNQSDSEMRKTLRKGKRKDSRELSKENRSCTSVLDILPQMYWFSQRYSYRRLGASCLSIITANRFSQVKAGECLRRLATEADCVDALKKDLLALATNALS